MGTWMWKCACLALLIQVAVGLPSFGTGVQIDNWNEVDDEHPGEQIPEDCLIPMRDPNGGAEVELTPTTSEHSSTVAPPQKTEENNLRNPVSVELKTLKPQEEVNNVDDKINTEEKRDSLSKLQEKEHNPTLVSRLRPIGRTRTVSSHEEIPAVIPTPEQTAGGAEVEDCECVECEEAIAKQKSGNGNGEELDCQDTDATSPHSDPGRDEDINEGIKVIHFFPSPILETRNEDKSNLKTVSQAERKKMGSLNENSGPKIIAGIMMKVSGIKDEDDAPCDSNNQEPPLEDRFPSIVLTPIIKEHTPITKGLLLKSLIPKENLAKKARYPVKKSQSGLENKRITSLDDVLKNRVKESPRFIALENSFGERPSENVFFSQLINSLRPNPFTTGPSPSKPFNSLGEYNEHLRKVDPQMKGIMDLVLQQMAAHGAFSKSTNDHQYFI